MNRNIKAVMKVAKKYRSGGQYRGRYYFAELFDKNLPVDNSLALFQSFDGKNFGGNPFYILKEMRSHSEWDGIHAVVAVNANVVERTNLLIAAHGFSNCEVVAIHSKEYCEYLCQAKYLINNSTFTTYFIKNSQQIYLNTWHGTPLKTMGRKMYDRPHTTGNTQRNFLMADYLLYPNRFSFEKFKEDYMVDGFFNGQYLLSGYPCNSVFFNEALRAEVREKLEVPEDKRVVVYMPTWRQTKKGGHRRKHALMSEFFLMNLDENLDEDVVVFSKLHYYDSGKKIDYRKFKKVNEFPADLETYELLNIADVLVTDYSSVMFDFLNAGKEIILFNYDEEEYFSSRGTYFPVSNLPFRRTCDTYELCKWLNKIERNADVQYPHEHDEFCSYDSSDAALKMCRLLFSQDDCESLGIAAIAGSDFHTDKKKILIFGGALTKNGLTTALNGVLNNVDLDENEYILTFYSRNGSNAMDTLNSLDQRIKYLPMQGNQCMTYSEAAARFLYYRFNRTDEWVTKRIDSLYAREAKRLFPGMHFDSVIHFTGYERSMVHTLLNCDTDNRIMYVHNDMLRERSTKSNYHVPAISLAYEKFDKIAVVRESLVETIASGFGVDHDKIYVVHNLNMIEPIRAKATLPLSFDEATSSNVTLEELSAILDDSAITKFIDVARFSPEKGLERLIDSFVRYYAHDKNSALIIIGGLGKDYKKIVSKVEELGNDRIILIKNLSNPINILSKSDVFVLSSFYEGLPMSIMEALILGKPVVSTAISGPKEFLEQGYGYLVEDSEEGVYKGLCALKEGRLQSLKPFDAESFNKRALEEFLALL